LKKIALWICIGVLLVNTSISIFPIYKDDFFNSNELGAEILRGLGIKATNRGIRYNVPRLIKESQINSEESLPFGVSLKQSEYYVQGWADSRWLYRKNITIDASKVTADLYNFPVLIDLYDADLQKAAQISGNDIIFTDESANLLDHEIELYDRTYNGSHAHLIAWVETNLSSSQDTVISMYYGNPKASSQENPEGVWDSDYIGIWHLTETGAGNLDEYQDSSQYNNHGQGGEGNTTFIPTRVDGKIGYAQDFNNQSGYYDLIDCGNDSTFNITGYSITLQAWIQHNITPQNHYFGIMNHKGWYDGYSLWIEQNSWKIAFNLPGESHKLIGATDVTTNLWHHIVATYDGAMMKIFIDGVQDPNDLAKIDAIEPSSSEQDFWIGHGDQPKDKIWSGEYEGQIDEVRVSTVARSTEWIQTEYNNQYNPSSFYSLETEEKYSEVANPPSEALWYNSDWGYRNKITIDHLKVGELPWYDLNWLYRKKITISANNSAISSDYALNFSLDHASLVSAGKSRSDGYDIRVVYWDGSAWTELDRMLDPGSSWNSGSTEIWFRPQSLIPASSVNGNYYLYYGNNGAGVPNVNSSNIFPFFDGFETGNFSGWDGTSTETGDSLSISTTPVHTGTYSVEGQVDNVANAQAIVWEDFSDENNLFARSYIYLDPSFSTTDHVTVMQFIDTSSGWQNQISATINDDMTLYMWNAIAGEAYGYLATNTISTGTWHTLDMQAKISDTNGEARLWLDGNLEIEATGINLSTEGVDRFAAVYYWASPKTEPNTLYMDDIHLNVWLDSKPIFDLGDETAQSLYDFPVLINSYNPEWRDTSNGGNVGQSDGGDFIFTSKNGMTQLDHEIEYYNPATGSLVAWVKIPMLSIVEDTNILLYYGNNAVSNQENPEGVWDENYLAIHHLNEDPTGIVSDSTGYNKDITSTGSMTSDDLVDGWIGQGIDFDGNNDGLSSGTSVSIAAFTYSAWFQQGTNYSGWRSIVSVGDDRQCASNNRRAAFWSGVNPDDYFGSQGDLPDGNWHFGTFIYDGTSNLKAYINGTQVGTIHVRSMSPVTDTFDIGFWRPSNPSDYFDGILDEIRISNISRSIDWVVTEFNNQFNPDSFYTVELKEIYDVDRWAFLTHQYRKKITIDSDKISGTGILVDFPLMIDLFDQDLNNPNKTQNDGDDILFTDCFGNRLNHEIELFNQTHNSSHAHLVAWLKIPYLLATVPTNFTMYYGNNAITNQENVNGVWNGYRGVWHLSEDPSGSAPQILDSTSNNYDCTSYGSMTSEDQIVGQIDGSLDFDGSDDGVSLPGVVIGDRAAWTLSTWIRMGADTADQRTIYSEGDTGVSDYLFLYVDDTNSEVRFYSETATGDWTQVIGSTDVENNQWHFVTLVQRSKTDRELYIDGLSEGTSTHNAGTLTTDTASIGVLNYFWGSADWFKGTIDEVRISNIVRTNDWIITEYNNQKDPTTFYTIVGEEINPFWWADSSFSRRKDIVIDHTQFGTTQAEELQDFPFLLEIYDSDLKTNVQSTGADILFVDADGNKLNHEIELFNQNFNGSHAYLLVWVRLPNLRLNADTILSMYYGNPTISSQENVEGVWTSDYLGVWHLKENGNGTPDEFKDSTLNNNDGQGGGSAGINPPAYPPSQVTGKIGFGQEFDESTQEHIEIPTSTSLESPSNSITMIGWVNAFISGLDGSVMFSNWGYGLDFLNGEILGHLNGTMNNVTGWVWWPSGIYTSLGWHQYAITYDGSFERLFIDGGLIATIDCNGTIAIGDPDPNTLRIGGNPTWGTPGATGYVDGQIDEVRVSTDTKTADWIQIEYKNQDNPSNLITIGLEVIFDENPPQINDFGVDDPGTGIGNFWADISDGSGVENVEITINNTEYAMSNNGTHWVYQLSVNYQDYYQYLITNASDILGNYISSNSTTKGYTFDKDTKAPDVLEWVYISENNTFQANVTDSWGILDTVIVNVTDHQTMTNLSDLWAIMPFNGLIYVNNTISMDTGTFDFVITANDTVGNSFTSVAHSGFVGNHIPVASNLFLTRTQGIEVTPIYSNSTLYLNYTYSDQDNDLESGTEIRWYKNGVLQSAYNDLDEVPASALIKGDEWNATVRPKDGQDFGVMQNSTSITIKNTPPTLTNVLISPSNPVTTSDLDISYTFTDTDGDSENISYQEIEWFNDSTHVSTYDNYTTLPSDETKKGEEWYFRIRCYDGSNYSIWVSSTIVTIGNSPPTASNLSITNNPKTGDDLISNWDYNDSDGDPEDSNWIIRWYKNSVLQPNLNDSQIVLSGNTSKDDVWHYTLRTYDGTNYSIIYTLTPGEQILNTAPEVLALNITPINPITNESLVAEWTFFDVDGDTEPNDSWIILWYKNGIHQSALDNLDSVSSTATMKGDLWNYTLQVFDGSNYSITYNSPVITILNSIPEVTSTDITSNPTSSQNLVASWTYSDIDGDNPNNYPDYTIIHWYKWNITQWDLQSLLDNSTVIGSGNTTRNEIWYYALQIFDGDSYSIIYSSPNTTIINSIPVVSNPSFNKTDGISTDDDLNITFNYYDEDNDPENTGMRIIQWYINGFYNASFDGKIIIFSENTTDGEFWQYKIRVFDGYEYSSEISSILIVIGSAINTLPVVNSLNITLNPTTNDNIIANYEYYDDDNHLQADFELFWFFNGVLQTNLNKSLVVVNWSIQYNSSIVTVLNSIPTVSNVAITANTTTSNDLNIDWDFEDVDGDSEDTYQIIWYTNGIYNNTFDDSTTIPSSFTQKTQIWHYSLQVFDGENYSVWVNSTKTYILNTPPTASNIALTSNPTTTDNLTVSWVYDDEDNDSENINWIIRWYKYGILNSTFNDLQTINSEHTKKGEYWYCTISVFDGEDYSITYQSASCGILNTAPIIQGQVNINPSVPVKGTEINVSYSYIDIDGDFEYGTIIRWYKNGQLKSNLNDQTKITGNEMIKGDNWTVMVMVSDGELFSSPLNSSTITVGNTAPQVDSAEIFPSTNIYTSNTLIANFDSSDEDGDSITNYSIIWKIGATPVPALENHTQVPSNFTQKNEYWTFEVRVFDGTDWSSPLEPGFGVIIQNSKPTIENVSLAGGSTTTEDIVLSYDFVDIDNDSEDIAQTSISWFNPMLISGPTGKTLDSSNFKAGDFVFVTIIPHDGETAGNPIITTIYSTGYIFIGNTPPLIIGNPNILGPNQSTSYSVATTLYANYSAADIDNESTSIYDIELDENGFVLGAEYRWFKNGELVADLTGPTVAPSYLTKGDTWKISVRPRDRYGAFGTWVNSSEIEIGNSWPLITSFEWRVGYPTTRSNISFRYNYFDADFDSEVVSQIQVQWFVNGTEISSAANISSLSYLHFTRFDTIYTIIRVFDGQNYSLPYQSGQIVIQNALPQAHSISLIPIQPYSYETLTLSWNYTDYDNDPENNSWIVYWYRNGVLVPEHTNKTTIEGSFIRKNELWSASFQVYDSFDYSLVYNSDNVIIRNSPSLIIEVTISDNSSQSYADDELIINSNLNIIFNDSDQDPLADYILYWFRNDVYQTGYDNQTTILASQLFKGDEWYVIVRIFDGDEWSQNHTSRVILIVNKPPFVSKLEYEFDESISHVEPDVRESSVYQFYVEDENITISYTFSDVDNDVAYNRIQWFKKTTNTTWVELLSFENMSIIPYSATQPGETWYCLITPFDGFDHGDQLQSDSIMIESRPTIKSYSISPDISKEGSYKVTVEAENDWSEIYRVEFETILTDNTTQSIVGTKEGTINWTFLFSITDYSYLNTLTGVNVKAISKVNNTELQIYSTLTFNFTIEDKAPPRVVDAFFTKNHDLYPTNLTFYADIEEYGSGIAEVILYYFFEPEENGGTGATLGQEENQWLTVPLVFESENATGRYRYTVTVEYVHNQQNMNILYLISTQDNDGNFNSSAFDIRNYPQRLEEQQIIYQPPGIPSWVLMVAGLSVVLILVGAIVYVKFIRKPELVGLDKELVMDKISEVNDAEVLEALDSHTIGVVVSFFDQRHGPIPIIMEPMILKDNFTKLVDLSDRSFSGTGFCDDFESEIPSSYDFVLTHDLRISVISFGFALERPQARGGRENLTVNLLIHRDIFPLVQAFQKQIQRLVHSLHLHMDKKPEEKVVIRNKVIQLRKFISQIIVSYKQLYGTIELIDEEE
jgi:hypothetical protein